MAPTPLSPPAEPRLCPGVQPPGLCPHHLSLGYLPGSGGEQVLSGSSGWGPSEPVDVLRALGVQDGRDGVSIAAGICTQRRGAEESDFAFRLENNTQLSAPTRQLFPDGPFPEDFSILATLRARRGSQAFLLSLYDERGVQQLGVEIGRSPVFLYEDQAGQPAPERYPLFSRVSLADGKWHRVALSVEGTNVSLLVDCEAPVTLPLERGPRPVVSTAGVTLLGTRLLDEEVFQGDVQQLLISPDPQAALHYCETYMPGCDVPLPYGLLGLYPEEVGAPHPVGSAQLQEARCAHGCQDMPSWAWHGRSLHPRLGASPSGLG
uniref:Laminin G domain-containing protein n=1 Tax=Chrysemys picta bellii TaxID=8478 RepID=A0A8C3HLN8_CHRPI